MKKFYTIICCLLVSSAFGQNWRYNYYDTWNTTSWNNHSQQVSVYLPDGRLDTVFANNYQGDAYSPFKRTNFLYNASGQLTERTTVGLTAQDEQQRAMFNYDAQGRLSSQTDEQRQANAWIEAGKTVFTYNEAGMLASRIEQLPMGNGAYADLHKQENSYDEYGRIAEMTLSAFESGAWQAVEKVVYTYGGNGKAATSLSMHNVDGSWQDSRRQEYFYNELDSLSAIRTDRWTEQGAWENYMKKEFSYDNSGARNLEIVSTWEGTWKNFSRTRFENDPEVLSLDEAEKQFLVYPNPVIDRLNIVSGDGKALTVNFVDPAGRSVLAASLAAGETFVSTQDLPAGVYHVVFSSGSGTFVERIVKL